jgi:hypothetical protein
MGAIDSRSSFQALLPEQFGRYSLLGHLATGGMAEVWLARQLGMQGFEKIVVIKLAWSPPSSTPTSRRSTRSVRSTTRTSSSWSTSTAPTCAG